MLGVMAIKNFGSAECDECGRVFKKRSISHRLCSRACWPSTKRQEQKARRAFNVLSRDEFRCVYCGKSSIEDGVKLSLDHIHPSSKGGEDVVSNLVTCCQVCNSSKGNRTLREATVNRLLRLVEIRNRQSRLDPGWLIKDLDPGVDDAD